MLVLICQISGTIKSLFKAARLTSGVVGQMWWNGRLVANTRQFVSRAPTEAA